MASHASKFLSDRVQADGVDKNVWEWAEKKLKNGLKLKYSLSRPEIYISGVTLAKSQINKFNLLFFYDCQKDKNYYQIETTRLIVTILLL